MWDLCGSEHRGNYVENILTGYTGTVPCVGIISLYYQPIQSSSSYETESLPLLCKPSEHRQGEIALVVINQNVSGKRASLKISLIIRL